MSAWQDIGDAVQREFSDLPDAGSVVRIAVRLLIAGILGGILGVERQHKGKAAGMRTHMLVAIGAALFVLVPQQAGVGDGDLTRVLQGLVAGIGFLCAGTIIKGKEEDQIKGLTTAAGLWLTAAVGVAAGMGRQGTAIFSTLLAFAVLHTFPQLARRFENDRGTPSERGPHG